MNTTLLPYHAGLQQYQEQAQALWQALSSGNQDAAWMFKWMHPRYQGKHVSTVDATTLSLADAQLVIALNYAFETWADLEKYTEEIRQPGSIRTFEDAVEAVVNGDVSTLQGLLRQHPDLASARSSRRHHVTLLHYLGANGVENARQKTPNNALEIARLLLEAGADPNALANLYDGRCTTMSMLVSSCHPAAAGLQAPLAELLADHGAALEGVGSPWSSAIMTALIFNYQETAQALARRQTSIDYLPMAAGLGLVDATSQLLPHADEEERHTALALATQLGQVETARLLLEAGEDPNRYNPDGVHSHATPLHHAAGGNHLAIAQLLVEHGARLDMKDTIYDATPLGWARHGGHSEMVAWLESIAAP